MHLLEPLGSIYYLIRHYTVMHSVVYIGLALLYGIFRQVNLSGLKWSIIVLDYFVLLNGYFMRVLRHLAFAALYYKNTPILFPWRLTPNIII